MKKKRLIILLIALSPLWLPIITILCLWLLGSSLGEHPFLENFLLLFNWYIPIFTAFAFFYFTTILVVKAIKKAALLGHK